jgi:hypothetical protein
MEEIQAAQQFQEERHPQPHTIEVLVNDREVTLLGHQQTGLEIKQAAIDQGVPIGIDFLLYLERAPRHTIPIGDNESITVTPRARFVAIANDDNS